MSRSGRIAATHSGAHESGRAIDTSTAIDSVKVLFERPMTRWRWVLLIFELFLLVVILIHPDVDLLDTAFRDGNSPVLAKLQVTTAPVMAAAITRISSGAPRPFPAAIQREIPSSERMTLATLRSPLCVMLC